ncbi:MAG: flagellar hook-length control protein FliK [Lachnospiraceae bacterium]|nr:flagellar hook-length control protein FliK [Lachnospiraceae bacterium]
MTAQGIMSGAGSSMNIMFAGFPAAANSVKGAKESSFEQFMEASQGGSEERPVVSAEKKNVTQEADAPKNVKEQAKQVLSSEGRVQDTKQPKTEEVTDVSPEAAEVVSTLLLQIKQVICETLEVTEEQLTVTMDELGLTDADLLDRDNLQQIFLNVNQADPTEFLTNENLFADFAEMVQTVEQVTETSGLTPEAVKVAWNAMTEETELPDKEIAAGITKQSESIPETDSEDGREIELPADDMEVKTIQTTQETKTETGNTDEGEHKTEARKDGDVKTISVETDANMKNVFIDALVSQVSEGNGEADLATAVQVREIANQIMEQIKITIRPEQTNMELQLNPEHLGRVNLTITEKEGRMTAQFMTQTEVAKEAIESQMSALRESLQNQGIKVEAIEVTVSEFGFEQDKESGRNANEESGRKRKSGLFQVEDAEDNAPQTMAEYINTIDSSVDYSA